MSRIGWRFKPALGCQQVGAAIAVDVARADAVSGRRGAKVVLLEVDAFAISLFHDLVPDHHVHRVGQDVGHAVSRQVDHPGRLDASRHPNFVIGPGCPDSSRVFDPAHVPDRNRSTSQNPYCRRRSHPMATLKNPL